MASTPVVSSVGEFLSVVRDPRAQLGLAATPVTPWYIGQPDLSGSLLPAFYKSKYDPLLEREMLRDYRQMSAEYTPLKGLTELDMLVNAHKDGLPTRIMEWSANPLVALFMAVEPLAMTSNARVWILNPWILNELVAGISYVPMIDSEYIEKYHLKLDDPDAKPLPEATQPMAFRPYRIQRLWNVQNTYFTIHGKSSAPLEELSFFLKRADVFLAQVLIDNNSNKTIMKELHDLGVNRVTLFPSLSNLTRTLAYRYSANYLKPYA